MIKDEIKNRISLALKDPILKQGFEIICKEYAELKAQNTSYEEIIDNSSVTLMKERLKTHKQLTEAKEVIEGLIRFCRCFAQHHTKDDIRYKEAEEFLEKFE